MKEWGAATQHRPMALIAPERLVGDDDAQQKDRMGLLDHATRFASHKARETKRPLV